MSQDVQKVKERPGARPGGAGVAAIAGGLAVLGAGSSAGAQDCRWVLVSTSGPGPRTNAAMAFDTRRGVTVLWGGSTGTDGWEWDGSRWRQIGTNCPAVGWGMAYDSARGRMVATRGRETWEWDGLAWMLVGSGGQGASGPELVYDRRRGVTISFGGEANGRAPPSQTWTWNGAVWSLVAGLEPPPRMAMAAAYDSRRGVILIHGGVSSCSSDTWQWDGARWSQVAMNEPACRNFHHMVYHEGVDRVLLFGGLESSQAPQTNGVYRNDLWAFDGAQWRRLEPAGPLPPGRSQHSMAYDSVRGVVVLFGGNDGTQELGDTWELRCTLPCYADCDQSTGPRNLDIFDFLCFQNRYDQRDPYACDCDTSSGPNSCDVFDFLCFQNAYAAGCP